MTTTNRPLAILFAAVMFSLLWVPTLSVPKAQAATHIPTGLA